MILLVNSELLVPMLRVGMQPVALCADITGMSVFLQILRLFWQRISASEISAQSAPTAFPREAWERAVQNLPAVSFIAGEGVIQSSPVRDDRDSASLTGLNKLLVNPTRQ